MGQTHSKFLKEKSSIAWTPFSSSSYLILHDKRYVPDLLEINQFFFLEHAAELRIFVLREKE